MKFLIGLIIAMMLSVALPSQRVFATDSTDQLVTYTNRDDEGTEFLCFGSYCGILTSGGYVQKDWVRNYSCLERKLYGACKTAIFQQGEYETWYSLDFT